VFCKKISKNLDLFPLLQARKGKKHEKSLFNFDEKHKKLYRLFEITVKYLKIRKALSKIYSYITLQFDDAALGPLAL